MQKAIKIAENQRCVTAPNPFVGAVIVKDDRIISSGWTQSYGNDHAEVQAIKNSTEDTAGADLYVTLEPCCHIGKTPPCTDAVIKAGIKNVYIGITDPNPKVSGKGIKILKNAGINVEYPFFEKEVSNQLEFYLKWIKTGLPFVIMKNAVSLDGKIAAENGTSKWITGEGSRKMVHELRQQVDAVLTTINTVKKDDPILNVRLENKIKDPMRIILDPMLEIDPNSQICKTAEIIKTIIFYDKNCKIDNFKLSKIQNLCIELIPVICEEKHNTHLNFQEILKILGEKKITSVMVEAGQQLNSYLFKNCQIDKLYYFIAPKFLGGNKNVLNNLDLNDINEQITLTDIIIKTIESDVLVVGKILK